MSEVKQKIILFFLITFSIYCALIIGQSWDEATHLAQGGITLKYLFSLGKIDTEIIYRENYSSIYWSIQYFITKIFPQKYEVQISHLVNLFFSILAIFGISKLCKILFNRIVGKIVFIILFLYPVFFGHMGFNSKDTILAFSHIWITYYIFDYLKNQKFYKKKNIFFISILASLSTGIQIVFLGSLLPLFLFVLLEIFFIKKIISKDFNKKKLFYDSIKIFFIFYFLLIFFWIDAHPNIFILPFNFLLETFSSNYFTGWPYNLVNGKYYLSNDVNKFYFLINFIYKTPEYILISYFLFLFLFFNSNNFFNKKFSDFNYKLIFLLSILIFPNLIIFFIPYPIYDGMRLFLWVIPYFCIIPGLVIYWLLKNINFIHSKISLGVLVVAFFFFFFKFVDITPYQYTYLNSLNGKSIFKYKKFEGDYWASSLNELIDNSIFEKNKTLLFSTCGVDFGISKKFLKESGYFNVKFVSHDEAEYIIMTNRVVLDWYKDTNNFKLINCFDKFKGNDISKVERNGMLLSVIRKPIN